MKPVEVNFIRDRVRRVRKIFGRCLRHAFDHHGDDLAGFAIVSWDMRGNMHSSYLTEYGALGESLMPAAVHDALNRHLAVIIAERTSSENITDA